MDIREARKTLGLSQAELATALGVNQATISRFEADDGGLEPNARTILAIEALIQRKASDLPADRKVAAL